MHDAIVPSLAARPWYTDDMYGKHHNRVVKVGSYILGIVVIASMVLAYFAGTV